MFRSNVNVLKLKSEGALLNMTVGTDFKMKSKQGFLLPVVKQRMRSVTNIQKITKAMKMVAASKLRVAQAATFESRGIIQPLTKLLGDLPGKCRQPLSLKM